MNLGTFTGQNKARLQAEAGASFANGITFCAVAFGLFFAGISYFGEDAVKRQDTDQREIAHVLD